jgi:hypothetical protein
MAMQDARDGVILSVHARPTKQEVMYAKLYWYLRMPVGLYFTLGGFFGPLVLYSVSYWLLPGPSANAFHPTMLIPAVFAVVMLLLVALGGMNSDAMRAYLLEGIQFVFTHERVETTGALASASIDWGLITKAVETRDMYFLRQGNALHLLPKRDFSTENDVVRFRELLKEKLGRKVSVSCG